MPSRQPRSIVKIMGVAVPGFIDWEVENNIFREADTFRVSFAVQALPKNMDASWLSNMNAAVSVEILAGFPANPDAPVESELESLILGNADQIHFDPIQNNIEISGRDLTLLLIDTKTTEKFQNQTASQIASALAQRHGLTPVVSETSTKVGKYYEIDHAKMNVEQSEWDLITWLAAEEQFVAYVKGRSLYFQPADSATSSTYPLQWTPGIIPVFGGVDLRLSRSLTLARDISVTVHSWNQKQKTGFYRTVTATKNGIKLSDNGGTISSSGGVNIAPQLQKPTIQYYNYTFANLTPDQATKKAVEILGNLSMHEMKMTATLLADNVLSTATPIQLQGTGTAWDQLYYPESVRRTMSMDEGYLMTVSAKNTSPQSVTQ